MFTSLASHVIEPVGESVLLVEANKDAPMLARHLEESRLPGVVDVVAAFDVVGVYYAEASRREELESAISLFLPGRTFPGRSHVVPVCYELGKDFPEVCRRLEMEPHEFVAMHANTPYLCRAIGFCPGFAYLGWTADRIARLGRRDTPRLKVEAGSVAIAERMTAVYPLDRPGGWWLVGRTPLTLADPETDYYPIEVGDTVEFRAISEAQYGELAGGRL